LARSEMNFGERCLGQPNNFSAPSRTEGNRGGDEGVVFFTWELSFEVKEESEGKEAKRLLGRGEGQTGTGKEGSAHADGRYHKQERHLKERGLGRGEASKVGTEPGNA